MPVAITKPLVHVYDDASSLPSSVWEAFRNNERDSNIMYPHAIASASSPRRDPNTFWMTCSSYRSVNGTSSLSIDLVLSCGNGPLGSSPIFIFATAPFEALTSSYLMPRIEELVYTLAEHVPVERVFSVFAPEPVTRIFRHLWSTLTRVAFYEEPYYAAKFATCTRETFVDRRMTLFNDITYVPRLAVESDLEAVADLCKGFASTSEPFILSEQGALKDAAYMIRHRCIWVLEARVAGRRPELSSIVASCRQSSDVAAITKVYTNPRWRKKGCAERLVRWVCKHLLKTKSSLVLYVAHDNPAAAGVYKRVGFVGTGVGKETEESEPWLEVGFDRSVVKLGHW